MTLMTIFREAYEFPDLWIKGDLQRLVGESLAHAINVERGCCSLPHSLFCKIHDARCGWRAPEHKEDGNWRAKLASMRQAPRRSSPDPVRVQAAHRQSLGRPARGAEGHGAGSDYHRQRHHQRLRGRGAAGSPGAQGPLRGGHHLRGIAGGDQVGGAAPALRPAGSAGG